ncbi:hypothetical protein CABS01_07250 [Colletotrichum abscissum]|uniref:uncharacterized protein n=1 Tax=Colletotrichum abscissum TaxID=1671311 RepID=UPI0027D76041|nr:uncharacterized protein CABS01_07250 [Colletotrichum abscissum]KAK1513844.1 hypothetical protein CABS01_07250 [Colletotrichum abscissum]
MSDDSQLTVSADTSASDTTVTAPSSSQVLQTIRSGFDWPLRFSKKGKISEGFENEPWLSYHAKFDSPRDAISFFLGFEDYDVRYHGRVRPILDICHNMDLHDLASIEPSDGEKQVAWLIDGQLVNDKINFRECLGALTARQLTEALMKPRYRVPLPVQSKGEGNAQDMISNEEVLTFDAERRLLEDGVEWDPCSGGQDDARKPFWFPRIWFLRIFGIRLDQIKDEWESICLHLGQNLDRQDRKYKILLHEAQLSPELAAAEDHRFRVNALEKSVLESRDVLQDLISVIQETLKAGASFLSTEVNFFLNFDGQPGDGSECYPYLSEIRRMFNVLNQLGYRLESYQARCSFLIQYCEVSRKNVRPLGVHCIGSTIVDNKALESSSLLVNIGREELIQVKLKNDQLLAIGPGDVEEVRVLAFSTLLTQAFSQTTALFSADGVIAFTRSWQTFLISLLVAYGINLTIGTAFLIWIRRARHKIQAALKATPLIPPVAQPTSNPSATSTVTLRSSSEAVTQTIATHTSSTNSDESGLTIYTRRRFSDRLWLSYRQPQRVDDVELGNRNVIEELT